VPDFLRRDRNRARHAAVAVAGVLVASVCSASSPAIAGPSVTTPGGKTTGVVYLMSGANSATLNVSSWELATGKISPVTKFRPIFGSDASYFGASAAGIVMEEASTGVDRSVRLSHGRLVPFPTSPLVRYMAPSIRADGELAFLRLVYAKITDDSPAAFQLVVRHGWNGKDRVVFSSREGDFSPGAFGPHDQLAFTVSTKTGSIVHVVNLATFKQSTRHIAARSTGVVWGPHASRIAIYVDSRHSLLESPSTGRVTAVAVGWTPLAFSPDGHTLLVARGLTELSTVPVARPSVVGPSVHTDGSVVYQAVWLAKAAPQ
jgi:hypothetical protein